MNSFYHNYKGYGIHPSECLIHTNVIDDITHICFEDRGIGTSVTNASEQLATEIVDKLELDMSKCKFYERYPQYTTATIDNITYTWNNNIASNPEWRVCNDPFSTIFY